MSLLTRAAELNACVLQHCSCSGKVMGEHMWIGGFSKAVKLSMVIPLQEEKVPECMSPGVMMISSEYFLKEQLCMSYTLHRSNKVITMDYYGNN